MAYYGLVTTLNNVRKDPNSDRLYLAEVFNEGVIVGSGAYEGQIVLYLPTDGKIERWFGDEFSLFRKNLDGTPQGGYIADNAHIRAIKLRGNESSGIILSLDVVYEHFGNQGWRIGDRVNEINGKMFCRKYIPEQKQMYKQAKTSYRGRKAEGVVYPEFAMHEDTLQLAYNLDKFHPGDHINMTLKLHGTSQRSMNTYAEMPKSFFRKLFNLPPKKKQCYVLGTRRCIVIKNSGGYYGNDQFRIQHHEALKPYLDEGMEVFYEVVGYYGPTSSATIMPSVDNTKINDKNFIKQYSKTTTFSYGCEIGQSAMYIYRITSDNGQVEWTPEEITEWCNEHGFNRVPIIEDFIYTTEEDMLERINHYFEDLTDPIGKTHIKEGVVLRKTDSPHFEAYKSKTWEFRVLEGLAKDFSKAPDMEEAQEQ